LVDLPGHRGRAEAAVSELHLARNAGTRLDQAVSMSCHGFAQAYLAGHRAVTEQMHRSIAEAAMRFKKSRNFAP
jgi:hypothetical protein